MPRARRSASPVRRPVSERPAQPPTPRTNRQPTPVQQQPVAMQASPNRQPGILGQMAATAGGVAIGSVVGHGVSSALFGRGNEAPAPQEQQPPQQGAPQQQPQICGWELQQFLNCTQNQQDISQCEGFNEALKRCRQNNGLMS